MVTSRARVSTASASRYLVQLCKHWSHKFAVEYTPEQGSVTFAPDRLCRFEAQPEALVMKLETGDVETLDRMEGVIVDHLKRFAFREELGEIAWSR
jgi:uncharacterized protein